jgi:hypothetical protein
MSALIETLKAERERSREERTVEYFALLASVDAEKPTAQQRKQLAALMSTLGKSAEAVEADMRTIADARRLRALAADVERLTKENDAAHAAHLDVCAACQLEWAKMNARKTAALMESEDARNRLSVAYQARGDLKRLRDAAPYIFNATAPAAADVNSATADN